MSAYSVGTASLGTGVTIGTGAKIRLTGDGSNLTIGSNNIVVDGWTLKPSYALLNGTNSPPTYILGSVYAYSTSGQYTNLTGNGGIATTLTVDTVAWTSGVQIYSVSPSYLSSVSFDFSSQQLVINAAANSVVNIYLGTRDKPSTVNIDGLDYGEGFGWSYNAGTKILTTTVAVQIITLGGLNEATQIGNSVLDTLGLLPIIVLVLLTVVVITVLTAYTSGGQIDDDAIVLMMLEIIIVSAIVIVTVYLVATITGITQGMG